MVGTLNGGLKAAKTNKELYGEDFYAKIGKKGGRISKRGSKNMEDEDEQLSE